MNEDPCVSNVYRRVCSKCGSATTGVDHRKDIPIWARSKVNNDHWWCSRCIDYYHKTKPHIHKRRLESKREYVRRPDVKKRHNIVNRKYRKKESVRQFYMIRTARMSTFMGKRIKHDFMVRCGVCNWCRAVTGIDTMRTILHHDENRYDSNNPLRFTIEICNSCHSTETWRIGPSKNKIINCGVDQTTTAE